MLVFQMVSIFFVNAAAKLDVHLFIFCLCFVYFRRLRVCERSSGYDYIIHQKIVLDELFRMMYNSIISGTNVNVIDNTRICFVYSVNCGQMHSQTWQNHKYDFLLHPISFQIFLHLFDIFHKIV
jgi:hypothetical protein